MRRCSTASRWYGSRKLRTSVVHTKQLHSHSIARLPAASWLTKLTPVVPLSLHAPVQPPTVRGRQEGIIGERRIRRTITYTLATGAKVVRTIVITGREDIAALNAICRRSDSFGEQRIPPKLSEWLCCLH
jgi:hypothetical protein